MKDINPLRIVLMSCAGSPLSAGVINYISARRPELLKEIVAVVLSKPRPRPDKNKYFSARNSLSQQSWLNEKLPQLSMGVRWRFNAILQNSGRILWTIASRFKPVQYRYIEDFCSQEKVNTFITHNINGEEAIQWMRSQSPDIIVVTTFHYILKRSVIDIPKIATINIHCSLLPKYRGADPINEALRDRVADTGVTMHLVDEGIDTGDIVLQKKVPVGNASSEAELRPALSRAAGQLFLECMDQARNGELQGRPQAE